MRDTFSRRRPNIANITVMHLYTLERIRTELEIGITIHHMMRRCVIVGYYFIVEISQRPRFIVLWPEFLKTRKANLIWCFESTDQRQKMELFLEGIQRDASVSFPLWIFIYTNAAIDRKIDILDLFNRALVFFSGFR